MKKQILFTLLSCLLSVSLTAADVSVTESYVTAPTGGARTDRTSFNGRYSQWFYRNARSKTSDKLVDGTRGFWLSKANEKNCYLESTLEGGIKSAAFKWRQFGTGDNGYKFVLNVNIDGTNKETITFEGADKYVNADQSFSKDLAIKSNSKLTIQNASTTSDGTTAGGRLIIGPVTITPYLLYTQKEVTIGTKQRGYVNAELIDNTDGDAITYSSSDTTIATVDSQTGVVTPLAAGETTITAAWSEGVTTTYTLRVIDNVIVENFSKVKQTGQLTEEKSWSGDLFGWQGNYVRRGVDDTIGLAPRIQATAMRYNEAGSYLYSANPIEGGVKHVTFDWRQWATATAPLNMYVYYSTDKENWGTAVVEQTKEAATAGTQYLFDADIDNGAKGNAYLKIQYTSGGAHAVVGAIKITPYLLYTQKAHTMRIGEIYTNTDLINNIESGSVTYKLEDNDEEASIDAATGEVTALAEGKVTVKATWSEGAYTTYTLTIIPANCETFDAIAETPNYANTEVLMGDMCEWTTSLGGFNVGDFAAYTTNLVRFRAPYQGSDEQAYIQSGVLSNGIKKLRFNWNVGGNETTTNWDIRILINGREVKRLDTTDLAANVMPEFGTITVENINEPGNFTIRFENHSTIEGEYTSANKARFLIDNIVWESYEETKSLDENVDNSGWLKSNEGAISDVQLVRSNLVANVYNTLCLPFAISKSTHLAGADVQEMTSAVLEGNVLTIGFTSLVGDELEAGVPYLVKPTTEVDLNTFTFSSVQIVAAPQAVTQGIVTLQGIFSPTEMIAGDQTTLFVGTPDANGDNLYYPSATANIKGFRAYFKLNLPDGMNAAPARARFVVNQTEVATGVEQVATQAQTTKMLRDGQLIILRDGVEYNAQGARVK